MATYSSEPARRGFRPLRTAETIRCYCVVVGGVSGAPIGGERRLCASGSGSGSGAGAPIGGDRRLVGVGEPIGGDKRLCDVRAPIGGERRLYTHERNRAKRLASCESREAANAVLEKRTMSSAPAAKTRIPFRINPPSLPAMSANGRAPS